MTGPALSRSDVERFCGSYLSRTRLIAKHLANAERACNDTDALNSIEEAAQQVEVLASELKWLQSEIKTGPRP
jgi:hypothetical protein